VRFPQDETKVFKIIWVNPDYSQFHIEYKGEMYDLPEFVSKVTDGEELKFDQLLYESAPGKWTKLGALFPTNDDESNHTTPDDKSFSLDSNTGTTTTTNAERNFEEVTSSTHTLSSTSSHAHTGNFPNFSHNPSHNVASFNVSSPPKRVLLVHLDDESSMPRRVTTYASSWRDLARDIARRFHLHSFDLDSYEMKIFDQEFNVFVHTPEEFIDFPEKSKMVLTKKDVNSSHESNSNSTDPDTAPSSPSSHQDSPNRPPALAPAPAHHANANVTTTNAYTNTETVTTVTSATSPKLKKGGDD